MAVVLAVCAILDSSLKWGKNLLTAWTVDLGGNRKRPTIISNSFFKWKALRVKWSRNATAGGKQRSWNTKLKDSLISRHRLVTSGHRKQLSSGKENRREKMNRGIIFRAIQNSDVFERWLFYIGRGKVSISAVREHPFCCTMILGKTSMPRKVWKKDKSNKINIRATTTNKIRGSCAFGHLCYIINSRFLSPWKTAPCVWRHRWIESRALAVTVERGFNIFHVISRNITDFDVIFYLYYYLPIILKNTASLSVF